MNEGEIMKNTSGESDTGGGDGGGGGGGAQLICLFALLINNNVLINRQISVIFSGYGSVGISSGCYSFCNISHYGPNLLLFTVP